MTSPDPLARLIVDHGVQVRAKLAAALDGRVQLDPEAGQLHITTKAGIKQRVVLALMGQQALAMLQQAQGHEPIVPDRLKPRDLEPLTGAKPGSIRPALKQLREGRLIAQDRQGYHVPGAMLDGAIGLLADGAEDSP
jgi:hypothetical protein